MPRTPPSSQKTGVSRSNIYRTADTSPSPRARSACVYAPYKILRICSGWKSAPQTAFCASGAEAQTSLRVPDLRAEPRSVPPMHRSCVPHSPYRCPPGAHRSQARSQSGSLFQNFLRIPYLRQPFTCLQNLFGERMLLLLPLRRKCAGIFLVGQSSCDDLHALLRLPLSFYLCHQAEPVQKLRGAAVPSSGFIVPDQNKTGRDARRKCPHALHD